MAVARHDLLVVDVEKSEAETPGQAGGLHGGELAAITLAGQEGSDWLLLDDQFASRSRIQLDAVRKASPREDTSGDGQARQQT